MNNPFSQPIVLASIRGTVHCVADSSEERAYNEMNSILLEESMFLV